MCIFLGWLVEGWHGTVSKQFRCGFYWKTLPTHDFVKVLAMTDSTEMGL